MEFSDYDSLKSKGKTVATQLVENDVNYIVLTNAKYDKDTGEKKSDEVLKYNYDNLIIERDRMQAIVNGINLILSDVGL